MPVRPGYGPPRAPAIRRPGRRATYQSALVLLAPVPVAIPFTWLLPPWPLRSDPPINAATIDQTGGATAYAANTASQAEYGVVSSTATLDTLLAQDAVNYATWLVNYYTVPRVRVPALTIDLAPRSDDERATILALEIGRRITLTGMPVGYPAEATNLVVEGTLEQNSVTGGTVTLATSPMIGSVAGTPGPWLRLGSSRLGGTDVTPF
jgi:hypothetical protein